MDVGTTLSQVDAVNESTPKMGCTDDVEDFEPVCDKPREINALEALRKSALETLGTVSAEGMAWTHSEVSVAAPLFSQEALLRFTRARPNNAASTKMLVASVRWRLQYGLEQKLREYAEDTSPEAERLRQAWPCGVHGIDRRGCPVYYARYGLIDFAALVKDAGFDRVLCQALTEQRQIENGLLAVARAQGQHPVQVLCVADFEGMRWGRAMASVKHFMAMQKVLDDHFPERLHIGVVLRAPRIFSAVYAMVEPFLAADTKAKTRVHGKSADHLAVLSEFVPMENIPEFLGGPSQSKIPGPHPS